MYPISDDRSIKDIIFQRMIKIYFLEKNTFLKLEVSHFRFITHLIFSLYDTEDSQSFYLLSYAKAILP